MSRPSAILLPVALLAILGCGPREPQPSVIVITIDSLRADHLHHAGDPRPLSPRLDRLAGESTRFAQAHASAPWTTPSVMTLFTGLDPASHHVDLNDRALAASVPTLPERLREAGYATAAVMPALTLADHFGFDRGFDEFIFAAQGHGNVSGPWSVGEAIRVLREHPGEPVFLYVHMWDVHYNYNPPVPQSLRFQAGRAAGPGETDDVTALTAPGREVTELPAERLAWLEGQYAGEILFTDEQVGRLLDELDRLGRAGDTLVVVTADHGEAFLEHGHLGHTVDLHEEMTHVPLLMRWPGRIPAGQVIEEQVGLVDLAPTVLDLLGLPAAPEAFDGRSLAAPLRGAAASGDGPPVMLGTSRRALKRGLRTPRVSYHLDLLSGEEALYDLQADPQARHNLAGARPAETAGWRAELCARLAAAVGRRLPIEVLPDDLQDSLAAGLRTLGYVGGGDDRARRGTDPEREAERLLRETGCPAAGSAVGGAGAEEDPEHDAQAQDDGGQEQPVGAGQVQGG